MTDRTRILLDQFTDVQLKAAWDYEKSKESSHTKENNQRIVVVIPFRDRWDLSEQCLKGLAKQSLDPSIQIKVMLIDNGSVKEETSIGLKAFIENNQRPNWSFDIIREDVPFNFSYLCNQGVRLSKDFAPNYVLFLNNDIELLNSDSISKFLSFATNTQKFGALGCTLLFPDRSIQHLFFAPGVRIVGSHPLRKTPYNPQNAWFKNPRPVGAVTGAVMFMRVEDFERVNGFDEELAASCQDIDLCLKFQKENLINWAIPDIVMIHHETATRSKALNRNEIEYINSKWGDFLIWNPYFSNRLSRWTETPSLKWFEGKYPWTYVV